MPSIALLCLLAVAACGVAGAPTQPSAGVALTGTASLGIAADGN